MALHISLAKNNLPQGLPKRPRVVHREQLSFDILLSRMAMDTAISATDMRATIDRFQSEVAKALADGQRVETPFGSLSASIQGKRNGDPVAPEISTENAVIRFHPSDPFLSVVRNSIAVQLEEDEGLRRPQVSVIYNFSTGTVSNEMSTNQLVELRGSRLTFSADDPEQGVFFVAEDGTETPSALYGRHGSARVDFVVPALAKGTYTVVVRGKYADGLSLRSGSYDEPVTIV